MKSVFTLLFLIILSLPVAYFLNDFQQKNVADTTYLNDKISTLEKTIQEKDNLINELNIAVDTLNSNLNAKGNLTKEALELSNKIQDNVLTKSLDINTDIAKEGINLDLDNKELSTIDYNSDKFNLLDNVDIHNNQYTLASKNSNVTITFNVLKDIENFSPIPCGEIIESEEDITYTADKVYGTYITNFTNVNNDSSYNVYKDSTNLESNNNLESNVYICKKDILEELDTYSFKTTLDYSNLNINLNKDLNNSDLGDLVSILESVELQ